MRTATTVQIKSERINISPANSQPVKENIKNKTVDFETAEKHYLLHNLAILLEASKYDKMENEPETAAAIIREYEFLSLVNDGKHFKIN